MSIVEESASVLFAKVRRKALPGRRVRRTERVLSDFGWYLKAHGLTAADAAAAFDVTTTYVYMWARGACRPGWKVARKIEAWTTERFGPDEAFVVDRWVA